MLERERIQNISIREVKTNFVVCGEDVGEYYMHFF